MDFVVLLGMAHIGVDFVSVSVQVRGYLCKLLKRLLRMFVCGIDQGVTEDFAFVVANLGLAFANTNARLIMEYIFGDEIF
jgi:hypothetical protein